MPPAGTLCPCGERPRRAPGQRCTPCAIEIQKTNRQARRHAGASAARAVRLKSATAPDPVRYGRPLTATRFLVTSAQNATDAHPGFLAALKVAAAHLGADLIVVPLRYRNPGSAWSRDAEDREWWAPELEPYLFNVARKLGPNLWLRADVKIQPTASSPLTGFESLTGAESCLIGHPKMQLRAVPAPSGRYPKILSTTGSVTRKNFSDTKAGALGAFHHSLGAVLVELEGRHFHLRQINADRVSGEFTDLDQHYTAAGVRPAPPALGLVLGDTHARMTCPKVDRATFGPGGIVEALNPETVVFHDLLDGYAVNPHHAGNPFISAAKGAAGLGNVRAEVEHAIEFVRSRARGRKAVIVASNHDDFLSRWIIGADWKHAGRNAAFYLETAAHMHASARMGPGGAEFDDPFRYWVLKLKGKAAIRCLAPDESFKLGTIECGTHGHAGPNGARGSLQNLSRVGAQMIIGHSHTPGIREGAYQTGTSTPLKLEYTHGPSSWLNTHCVVYASGKRALITIVDGRWRAA